MIVFDTNVISALMLPDQNRRIVDWADTQPQAACCTTAITVLEIRYGILVMPHGKRREMTRERFEHLIKVLFKQRVLPFDSDAAETAAAIAASRKVAGRKMGPPDTQIAGIAISRGATLATRNVRDFSDLGLKLVDPWAA